MRAGILKFLRLPLAFTTNSGRFEVADIQCLYSAVEQQNDVSGAFVVGRGCIQFSRKVQIARRGAMINAMGNHGVGRGVAVGKRFFDHVLWR